MHKIKSNNKYEIFKNIEIEYCKDESFISYKVIYNQPS